MILKNEIQMPVLEDKDENKNTHAINNLFSDTKQIDELNAKPVENVRNFDYKMTFFSIK